MTLIGGAGAARPHALQAASLPDAAAEGSVQREGQDFPLVIATMPATDRQRAVAVGIIILLIVAVAVIAPFASIQLPQVHAFIPVLQTVVSVVDLVTAILLFAQFSIQPHRALLALASGYIFSGSFAFLQTLAFPGTYAPAGLIGDDLTLQLGCSCFGTRRFRQRSSSMLSPRMRLESPGCRADRQ